jgi:hypothetical protein
MSITLVSMVVLQAGGKGPKQYNGTMDAWKKIAATEGSKAFFKVPHSHLSAPAVQLIAVACHTTSGVGTCPLCLCPYLK